MDNHKLISGPKTYYVRDSIKASGGKWDATAKGWWVPQARAVAIEAMLTTVPATNARSSRKPSGMMPKPGAVNRGVEVLPVTGPTVAKANPRELSVQAYALLENSQRVTELRAEALRLLDEADALALLCREWSRAG